jgi:hypothetical protein
MFVPFEGDEYFGNVDLASADTYTVACKSKTLGDPTMWDDISMGLKPAWVLLVGFIDGLDAINQPREALKARGSVLADSHKALYIGSKGACHGSNYQLQAAKGVEIILKKSGGKIILPVKDFEHLQRIYFKRYEGVLRWHDQTKEKLMKQGWLRGASGHKRVFFGRRSGADTLREALAEEPQHNTSVATNKALIKLMNEGFNRDLKERMIVNPVHTVHDSIMFTFKKIKLGVVEGVLEKAFDNTLIIDGQLVKIPYEWEYGAYWGDKQTKEQSLIGRCNDKG